ncbi:amidohydrolase family protein [Streptomyces sp. NPDC057579]|uniref:amidohydrolase family protein n=1 Tax=Streptomyces sp. NPDC057579 TaxID=3346172 RepID=UPI0036AE545C
MQATVDVHAHLWAAAVEALVAGRPGHAEHVELADRRLGAASVAVGAVRLRDQLALLVDVESRLGAMDAMGVVAQVVSVTPTQFHHWVPDPGLAAEVARATNEAVAGHCALRPDRLTGLGVVPQQFAELAPAALEDAVLRQGLRGVALSSHAPGPAGRAPLELSDRRYDALWQRAVELEAVVFLHPWGCTLDDRLARWYLANSVGQPVEHAVALSHIIVGGVLDRFPGLRILAAHGGGYLPGMLGRVDHAWANRPEARTTECRPSSYVPRLFFDSLVYEPEALVRLIEAAGPDHVLLGSDHPFDMGVPDPVARLHAAGLNSATIAAVASENAVQLNLAPTRARPTLADR